MGTPVGFTSIGGFNGSAGLAGGFGEAFGTFGAGFPDIGGGDALIDFFSPGGGGFANPESQGGGGGGQSILDIIGGILGSPGGQSAIGGLLGGLFGGGNGGGSNDQIAQLLRAFGGQGQGNAGDAGVLGGGGGAGGLLGSLGQLLPLLGGLLGGSEDERAKFGSLNPGFATLLNLFGSKLDPERGVVDDADNAGVFKGQQFQDAIRQLITGAPGLTRGEQNIGADFLNSDQPASDLARARDRIGRLLGQGETLISDGFRTSAQPAFAEAERRLRQNILPQIAEIAGQQQGISSSSFLDSANRASSDLFGEAAIQQLGLDEAAAGRRASGLGLFGQLVGTELGLQPAFANDLSALGGTLRNVTNAQQARPLDVLQILSGLGNGQQFIQQGFNPAGNGTTQLLEGLTSALPGLANVLKSGQRPQGNSLSSLFG